MSAIQRQDHSCRINSIKISNIPLLKLIRIILKLLKNALAKNVLRTKKILLLGRTLKPKELWKAFISHLVMSNSLSLGKTRKSNKQTKKRNKKKNGRYNIQFEALENTNTFKSFTLI